MISALKIAPKLYMKKDIENLSTNYFEVKYNTENKGDNVFVGEAVVIRKDTGEETKYGCVKYGNDINEIEKLILDSITKISDILSTQPIDWNSKTRKLLASMNNLQNYKTGFLIALKEQAKNGRLDEFLTGNFAIFSNYVIENTKNLIVSIETLTQDERKELLISSEDIYKNPNDAWNLDDLSLRNQIFKFFINPSTEEIDLHAIHVERYKRLFDEKSSEKGGI